MNEILSWWFVVIFPVSNSNEIKSNLIELNWSRLNVGNSIHPTLYTFPLSLTKWLNRFNDQLFHSFQLNYSFVFNFSFIFNQLLYVYYKFHVIRTSISILFRILKMGKIIFVDIFRGFKISLRPEFFDECFCLWIECQDMDFVYVYYKFQVIRTLISILFRILKMGKIIFADVLRGFKLTSRPEFFDECF